MTVCKTTLFIVMTCFLMAGCSSAPPPPEGVWEQRNRAADYLRFGQQSFQQGQYDQALSFFLIAMDLDTAVDDAQGMAVCGNSLASTYLAEEKLDDAAAALKEAQKAAERAGDPVLKLQTLNTEIQVLLRKGDSSRAVELLTATQPFPDTKEGALLWHALGSAEKNLSRSTAALADFQKALEINSKLQLKQEMASNRFMMASIYSKSEKYNEARAELLQALSLDKSMENTPGIGQDLRALGSVSVRLGDTEAAFDYLVRSVRVFQAAGMSSEELRSIEVLLPLTENKPAEKALYLSIKNRLTVKP